MSVNIDEVFGGARRQRGYIPEESPTPAAPAPPAAGQVDQARDLAPESGDGDAPAVGRVVSDGREIAPWDEATATASTSSWSAFLARLGFGRGQREAAAAVERAECERIIRQRTWRRAVNVAVHTSKGSTGCTPFALALGGALSSVRGGQVTVLEGTVTRGDLATRAEGNPPRGLGELLAGCDLVESAGNLAGYTAPQTSHAAVIGSIGERERLSANDVARIRTLIDRYAQLSVTDLGRDESADSTVTALEATDAVVIPAVLSRVALERAVQTAHRVLRQRPDLRGRMVLVLGHSGAPEHPRLVSDGTAWLVDELESIATVMEVPFDPVLQGDGEITWSSLSPASAQAWLRVAAQVVSVISDERPVSFGKHNNESERDQ